MTIPREIQRRIRDIQSDNQSGSLDLTKKAASTIQWFAQISAHSTPSRFRHNLIRTSKALLHAQPAMAGIVNLVDAVVSAADEADKKDLTLTVGETARDFAKRLDRSSETIARKATALIKSGSTILTHSFSSTVLRAMLLARTMGKRFNVICTESRPMCEGAALARKLGRSGIPAKLVIDAAVFSFLPEASCVMVGADAISLRGVVNKAGTYGIAVAAKARGIPFFALCGAQKLLPESIRVTRDVLMDPAEILGRRVRLTRAARAVNIYFDSTPLSYVTKFVTEEGVISAFRLRHLLKSIRMSKLFRARP